LSPTTTAELYDVDEEDLQENPGSITWTGDGNADQVPDAGDDSSLCFSAFAEVQVLNFGPTAMKDLRVGDLILTGKNRYEPFYAFAHQNRQRHAEFLRVYTLGSNKPLELTPNHMVFLEEKVNPVRADAVQIGDVLRGDLDVKVVTRITSVKRKGIYAPLTKDGTLVVDGIVASSYISLQRGAEDIIELLGGAVSVPVSQQMYCHWGLSPFRLFCGLARGICNSYNKDGMPRYISFALWLTKWVHNQNIVVEGFYLVIFFIFTGACMLLESCSFKTVVAMMIAAGAFRAHKKFQVRALIRRQKQKID
jgi:hypothetical protein